MRPNIYQEHTRLDPVALARLFAGLLLRRTRRFLQADPVESYTQESRHIKPGDPARPMWSNLGYWKNARKLAEVCADMARKLATAADLRPGEHLLDVDCGCAEQDLLWVREYDVGTILGIENTPLRVDLANASVADAGLGQRIEIRNGSATRCPFAEESFDKIMALECAFHFRTRELFFSKKLIVC